ncbi:hypothetical protein OAM18_03020 [Candidatus Pelagibacter sp.]|jgi:hypothetical protein|nr:hypothetical protein [Candidatus Pelagibacter sp.]|tara:strand:- start:7 stop:522 length:516 start_codon:yes stop_codon:yes gene_type:complete
MLSNKVKEHLNEYISSEIYVQIAITKGKNKISTKIAINKYFESNHFLSLVEGRPYNTFLDDLKDKCLGKLINSPMKDSKTNDKIIIELQKKLNSLKTEELNDTYWEVETGEYLSGADIKEIELERDTLIKFLTSKEEAHNTVSTLCENYEKLCKEKYPEAPLPLEILDIKH